MRNIIDVEKFKKNNGKEMCYKWKLSYIRWNI